jgi:hypothetical protein
MASEALVDLSYRGLVLGKRVRLLQVGPQSAYVAHDAPMPVGTHLVLTVDQSLTIPAQVARVREADTKDGPAGMWLRANVVEDHARAWWDAHVTAEDPRIPEPAGGRIRTEAPVVPAPAATPAVAPPVEPEAEPASTPEAQPAVAAAAAAEAQPAVAGEAEAEAMPAVEREAEAQPAVAAAAEVEAQPAVAGEDEAQPAVAGEDEDEAEARAMHEDVEAEEGERPESREDDGESEASSTERFAAFESMAQVMEDDRDPDDSGYDIHIRASTNVEFVPMAGYEAGAGYAADASNEAAEGNAGGEVQERRPRGTAVMTAVEIADVLGMAPLTDDDGDGDGDADADDEAEPVGRQREFRTTHVMSAVEVAEVLQGSSTPEPPKDEGKGKGRKRRGRKRR